MVEGGTGFDAPIWLLLVQLMILSFAAVGGGLAMLMPELQRFMVIEHQPQRGLFFNLNCTFLNILLT